ncbi:hypothetical protein FRC10_002119 [Ceratobasidium sp. 414]|nr:hypothetical protein FRC10_002119 [Ceratobasidium sp. 414]
MAKWLDDLIDTTEHASSVETPEEVEEEKAREKQARTTTTEKANKRVADITKTSQAINWDFDDLEDVEGEDLHNWKTGLRHCGGAGLFSHAIQECLYIESGLRERVAQESDELSVGSKVAKLDAAKFQRRAVKSTPSSSQPSVQSLVISKGRKAKQVRFDLAVLNFVAAAQLSPFKLDPPEFHAMISVANSMLKPKSSGCVASCQIPMESTRLKHLSVEQLKEHHHLTISFGGGSTIRLQSFTTIHVTTPDTRIPYLMEALDASGVSHTGQFHFKEIERVGKLHS